MVTWDKVKTDPRFAELDPAGQIAAADRFFAESVKDKVDPSSDRFQNLKSELRRRIMPDLKIGQGEVPQMSTAERFWAGLKGGTEDLGFGAVQLANDALQAVGAPGAEERGERLKQEAVQMAARKQHLYDTTAGTVGQIAPALLLPGSTIPKAVASGLAYGATQPVTEEGERVGNALGSGAAFGAGSALGNVAAKGIERVISPVRGG